MMGATEHDWIDMLIFLEQGALVVGEYKDDHYDVLELSKRDKAMARFLKSFKNSAELV